MEFHPDGHISSRVPQIFNLEDMGLSDIGHLRAMLITPPYLFHHRIAQVGDDGVIGRKFLRDMVGYVQKHILVIDNRFFEEMKTSNDNHRRFGARFDFADDIYGGIRKRVFPKKARANLREIEALETKHQIGSARWKRNWMTDRDLSGVVFSRNITDWGISLLRYKNRKKKLIGDMNEISTNSFAAQGIN